MVCLRGGTGDTVGCCPELNEVVAPAHLSCKEQCVFGGSGTRFIRADRLRRCCKKVIVLKNLQPSGPTKYIQLDKDPEEERRSVNK